MIKSFVYRFAKIFAILFCISIYSATAQTTVHVWELQELTFVASNKYSNAYADVKVWVDLAGPSFNKRIYGFWDGSDTFRVRLVATAPGQWNWKSGSSTNDPGIMNRVGAFTAVAWTEDEKKENLVRRGFLRASPNKHALIHADSTPFFTLGDTWFPAATNRFKWYDDDKQRPIGPQAGFKDYVRLRKEQGFNWVTVIAAFPNWKTDDSSWLLKMNDSARTTVRSAWMDFGTKSAKDMVNEGGKPFFFPGKVPGYEEYFPDMDRLNPEYFKELDKKIAYLNKHGFIPYIEAFRRDASMLWSKYYDWPGSFTRYIQYIYSRYGAYNTVLSPVHMDIIDLTISPAELSEALRQMVNEYGPLPFDNLLSANANPSTLENWGEDSWITLHQIGNKREHNFYWYLTQIYNSKHTAPALNGEPYYAGYSDPRGLGAVNYTRGAKGGTEKDAQFVRSCMYGSFLSGALAGHVYGAEGIWGGDIEPAAPTKMWDAFTWSSAANMRHLKTFAFSIGESYQDLEPMTDLVTPNKNHDLLSYEGWAYCARTPDRENFLVYFEKNCPRSADIRGAKMNSVYDARWFDPVEGKWFDVEGVTLNSSTIGVIRLPNLPGHSDWGLKLTYKGPLEKSDINKRVSKESELKKNTKRLAWIGGGVFALLLGAFGITNLRKR